MGTSTLIPKALALTLAKNTHPATNVPDYEWDMTPSAILKQCIGQQ